MTLEPGVLASMSDHEIPPSVNVVTSNAEGYDWTVEIPDSEHVRFFRSRDWAVTPLGPLDTWGNALRIHTFTVLADSRPATLYWGPKRIAIYNEAFVPLAGEKHPFLMGAGFADGFPELTPYIQPVFDLAESTGRAANVDEMPMMVERNNFVEEAMFTGNFTPIRGDSFKIEGLYNAVHEMTKQMLHERRTAMLNSIGSPMETYTTETVGQHIIRSLEQDERDIPMAILYQVDDESVAGKSLLRMTGQIGVPDGHVLAFKDVDLASSSLSFLSSLRKSQLEPITVIPGEEFEGIEWRGFGEPSKFVGVVPLRHGGRLFGFMVTGTNPRLSQDSHHTQLLADLSRQVSSTIAAVVSKEDYLKRYIRLQNELAESERQIRYLAQNASVAMQQINIDGNMKWANEHYYTLTGHSKVESEQYPMSFIDVIHEDDRENAKAGWYRLTHDDAPVTTELKLAKTWLSPTGQLEPTTILAFAFPYHENGVVKSVMSCMTDVSRLKWAEAWQARSAAEAREAKRQQEEFIDAISHEVRNPLSAIFQLADLIGSSLKEIEAQAPTMEACLKALADNVDSAKTILLCAKHQKRIVDDVLTLSKLDFMMLSLSPSPVQPRELVEGAAKMFEADAASSDISLHVVEEGSFAANNVDWVSCDPSRVTQVLINLLSNAIKFTKDSQQRAITIKYGAAMINPRDALSDQIYWAPNHKDSDIAVPSDWDEGEQLYLIFSVADTGGGMTEEETHRLFNRFEQANSRTFVKYGGSGLGLFISQRLSKKQGGDIGVMSSLGNGSTFAFYIKASRSEPLTTIPPFKQVSMSCNTLEVQEPTESDGISLSTLAISPPLAPVPAPEASQQLHLLLVEDNIVNQQILRKQLIKAGCVVYVANHGLEALDILKTTTCWHQQEVDPESLITNGTVEHSPAITPKPLDFILMDWEMPIMDGITCSKEIRSLQKQGMVTRHIEIIAITANTRKEQIDTALEAGIDDVMPKPFVVRDLMEKIRERLRRRQAETR